jgi:hypothetical protein
MSDKSIPYDEDACWASYEDELHRNELMSNNSKGGGMVIHLKPGRGAKYQRIKDGRKFEDFIISIEED